MKLQFFLRRLLYCFVPKHPNTKPKLERIIMSEEKADLENLIKKAIDDTELLTITKE